MRTTLYFLVCVLLLISGGYSLESRDWDVRELPSFLEVPFDRGERVLPLEYWEETLTGKWKFVSILGSDYYKGSVEFNGDGTFIRKLSYETEQDDYTYKAGGTLRGRWLIQQDKTWTEIKEDCVIQPVHLDVCGNFSDTLKYGEITSDTWNYHLAYFNHDRIEIRANNLAGTDSKLWKFTRDD